MQNNDDVIAAIAAALPPPKKPYPPGYESDTEQEVRVLYAESWVRAGFDDPSVVVKWTSADVQDPSDARNAERQGFRPDDPWVSRSGPSFALSDGMAITPPSPADAITNREVAQAQWEKEQAREVEVRAKAAAAARSMANLMRGLDYDDGFSLTALDLLAGTGQQATAEDVARAFNELTTAVHVMRSQANTDGFVSPENMKHVRYMQTMAAVVEQQAGVCPPKERRAILSQLRLAQDWLASAVS